MLRSQIIKDKLKLNILTISMIVMSNFMLNITNTRKIQRRWHKNLTVMCHNTFEKTCKSTGKHTNLLTSGGNIINKITIKFI